MLLLFAVCAATATSMTQQAYSVRAPKRILLQHVFMQQPSNGSGDGGGIVSDHLVIGGSDVVQVEDALDLAGLQRLPKSYRDWQVRICFWPATLCVDVSNQSQVLTSSHRPWMTRTGLCGGHRAI